MLSRLLGYDTLDTLYFRQPWPMALMLLLIAAALAASVFLYVAERSLPRWKRIVLGVMRAALLLLVILLLFEPVGATTQRATLPGNILVLLDISESMSLADARRKPEDVRDAAAALGKIKLHEKAAPEGVSADLSVSRLELARAVMTNPEAGFLRDAGSKHRLHHFAFGERLEAAPDDPAAFADWLKKLEATAASTRLGDALQQAVERLSGQPIAGIVVLTDGASNEGIDALEAARGLRVPIYPLAIGLPQPDDIRLATVSIPETVFPKDKVPVRVQIESTRAFENRQVELSVRDDAGRVLDSKPITLAAGGQLEELAFIPEQKTGRLKLQVSVSSVPGEASDKNNVQTRTVRIIDDKIKVLFVEGRPRWEFRYLRAVLERDPRMAVKFLMTEGDKDLAQASDRYLAQFPQQEAAAFDHDLVILGDVPADYFTPAQLEWLEKLVREKGGSFLMLAGHRHAPMTYIDTPVAKLLPVKLAAGGRQLVEPSVHPTVTKVGKESMMMSLETLDVDNQAAWSLVQPLHDVPRLEGAKPAASVLATLSNSDGGQPYPLIAWQRYGSGKVMYVGTDQLWRLRFKRGDAYHARFWGQAIQFLTLSRLLGENKRVRLEIDKTICRTSEPVLIQATVFDSDARPLKAESYSVLLDEIPAKGSGRTLTLKAVPGVEGLFQGFFTAESPGTFQVRALAQDEASANKVEFQVEAVNREMLEPAMQKDRLQKIAELSKGKYLQLADLPELARLMPDQSRVVALPPQETELWSNWWILFAILGLAGGEWFMRRQSDVA